MRDPDPTAPEIVAAGEEPSGYFGEVRLQREGEAGRFRFGITSTGYAALQRVLATRPFDAMPGLSHRYVYAGHSAVLGEPVRHQLRVRVELGNDARTLDFDAPADLVGALEWFRRLPGLAAAEHLAAPI
jgi:hypothetical protein